MFSILHIFKKSKTRRENVAKTCIDYKKAYDMSPQNWIRNC